MTETPVARGRRGLRQHDSTSAVENDASRVTTTPFDARIAVGDGPDGRIEYTVTVRVPTLDRVVEESVADVVVDGWADTFRRRVEHIGSITQAGHDLEPTVTHETDTLVARVSFTDLDPHRGANDAVAVADYVEGVYVQGVIPGYDYGDPVAGLIDDARAAGGGV